MNIKLFATIKTDPDQGDYLHIAGKWCYIIRTEDDYNDFVQAVRDGKEPFSELGVTCSSSIFHVAEETNSKSLIELVERILLAWDSTQWGLLPIDIDD